MSVMLPSDEKTDLGLGEVKVAPGHGPRDWHGNHNPAWSTREFPSDVTRLNVLDNYQQDVELLCPVCNLKAGARG